MKRNLIICFGIFILLSGCSSSDEFDIKESEVPPSVLSAFRAKYPNVQVTKWEAQKEDGKFYFEAEFKEGGKEKEIHVSPDGSSVTEED
jgi:hypothetical protein